MRLQLSFDAVAYSCVAIKNNVIDVGSSKSSLTIPALTVSLFGLFKGAL